MKFLITDNVLLTTRNLENYQWISGVYSGTHKFMKKNPKLFMTLVSEDTKTYAKEDILIIDEKNGVEFSYYLSQDRCGWITLGSNFNSVSFIYGKTDIINQVSYDLENMLFDSFKNGTIDKESIDNSGFSVAIWEVDNEYSLLGFYNDSQYGFEIPKITLDRDVLLVMGGAHSDDLLVSEILLSTLSKEIINLVSDKKLKSATLEFFEDFEDSNEFIFYNGKYGENLPIDLLVSISKFILFDMLNYKFEDKEVSNRLIKMAG